MGIYKTDDFTRQYEENTAVVVAVCKLTSELVGGQPADRKAIEAFVEHHLGITDQTKQEEAVNRILQQEIGERDTTPKEGELETRETYGVNVIRRDENGPWLGNWMIKACLKAAFSRLGLFVEKRGSKGNVAELGRVRGIGISRSIDHPERIYIRDGLEPEKPAKTVYREFSGRVQTPQGAKSIKHHSEVIDPGAMFCFEFRFLPKGGAARALTEKDIVDVLSAACVIGLGSAKALERGKFEILECTIDFPKKEKAEADTEEAQVKEQ